MSASAHKVENRVQLGCEEFYTSMLIGQLAFCVRVVASSDGLMRLSHILAQLRLFSLQNGLLVFGLALVRPSGNHYKGSRNNLHTQGLV